MTAKDKYDIRTDLYFDPVNHFWLDIKGSIATFGMSPLTQETSGSFVAIQFAESGTGFKKNEGIGTVEAEKHVGPIKAPLSGKILTVNSELINKPRMINEDPYGQGWLMEIELSDLSEIDQLISGEKEVNDWFESEFEKFNEKGWIAQP